MKKRYRLYFDESGDHTFKSLGDPARRYLGLTGIMIETEYYRTAFHPTVERFKQNHFPHDPDYPLVLHREDLIHKRGAFSRLQDPSAELAFNAELLAILVSLEYRVISVVLDKQHHIRRHGDAAYHPYHFCLAALLERYCGYLDLVKAEGDVMGESRAGCEDRLLKDEYRRLYREGTYYHECALFQRTLTSCEIKLKKKDANIVGLQIADILAHPCKQDVLIAKNLIQDTKVSFGRKIAEVIGKKYNRQIYQDRIDGYGRIFIYR
jgi:hypothetical protein